MNKRRNFCEIESSEGSLFVQEIADPNKVYLVEEKDFDDSSKSGLIGITCIVLEYKETIDELIYSIKSPETIIIMKRGHLASVLFTD
ncbi:hypothetical protein DCS32_13985 [Dokdonia sp. Dokd-P16]|uniref:hypothetical protein n=1 Tax=Dokdonia sp. Dokd-P16 TaxID=2173169 RepID=UPI000D5499B6|nr:hypothetical protein [Dokdonia sp. Dokd-P16]AWH75232.1 hypothetical protein DCS32_13985 [Dokdonia sp. Dokd-P16]